MRDAFVPGLAGLSSCEYYFDTLVLFMSFGIVPYDHVQVMYFYDDLDFIFLYLFGIWFYFLPLHCFVLGHALILSLLHLLTCLDDYNFTLFIIVAIVSMVVWCLIKLHSYIPFISYLIIVYLLLIPAFILTILNFKV